MSKYASKTEVSTDRSRAEIERTLTRYGATGFMYGWTEKGAVIGFQIKDKQYKGDRFFEVPGVGVDRA